VRRHHALPEGKYTEKHQPVGTYEAYTLTASDRMLPLDIGPETDDNGVRAPRRALNKIRARLSRFYLADAVQKPTTHELEAVAAHSHDEDQIHELTEDTETYREVSSDTPRSVSSPLETESRTWHPCGRVRHSFCQPPVSSEGTS
jgi:hypothetical protein